VTASILCIDDEPTVGAILEHILTRAGHRPTLVTSIEEGMRVIARAPVDLIIADYRVPGRTGLDLLAQLDAEGYKIPVIIMTGYSSIEHAVVSIKAGAIDYLTKPIQAEALEIAVQQALEVARLRRENETFRREIVAIRARRTLVGDSEPFRRAMEEVATVAASRATVLLQGESGTGKELFARAIHDQSPRADQPFVTVNCAALPEGLVESTLGHEKGAFAGATVRSAGAFERAHGGTLLLDEISEMRLDLQSKLLRVIQEQKLERVGGHQPVQVDVRVIATTNRDLNGEVDAGRFRSDLHDCVNALPIRIPSLRQRVDDIPRLVHHFVSRSVELHGGPPPMIAPETLEMLQRYSWPGNVRELANAVERGVMLSRSDVLQPKDFDQQIRENAAHPARPAMVSAAGARASVDTLDYNLDALERVAIERALAATGGNRTRAARLLGISERTLRNKLNHPRAASGG
jgi:DNA-binding NtrC family response regulator